MACGQWAQCGVVVEGGGGGGGGVTLLPLLFSPPLPFSFLLPQDDINEAADETQRESHPGQHVGVAEF